MLLPPFAVYSCSETRDLSLSLGDFLLVVDNSQLVCKKPLALAQLFYSDVLASMALIMFA